MPDAFPRLTSNACRFQQPPGNCQSLCSSQSGVNLIRSNCSRTVGGFSPSQLTVAAPAGPRIINHRQAIFDAEKSKFFSDGERGPPKIIELSGTVQRGRIEHDVRVIYVLCTHGCRQLKACFPFVSDIASS